ncbi:hypothetical protein [Buchananella felis]|uniref:hypothetical protein n=1 Tax=Buchananella felis TaxID=3231492 RepID=UPI003527CC17
MSPQLTLESPDRAIDSSREEARRQAESEISRALSDRDLKTCNPFELQAELVLDYGMRYGSQLVTAILFEYLARTSEE